MSKVPAYSFYQRDAAKRESPKQFCDALIATGRFWRDERGVIRFKIADGDYMRIERAFHLQQILQDGEVLQIAGDVDENCFSTLWLWATSRKHTFPRLNNLPYNPPAPLGVAHVAPQDRYRRGRDVA